MALSRHSDFFWSWDQAVDPVNLVLVEGRKSFSMNVSIPSGFERENLKVTVADDVLTVSGKVQRQETKDDNNVHTESHSFSSFSRSIRLPNSVDQEGITAGWNRGLLHVDLPKKEAREAVSFEVPVSRDVVDVAKRSRLDRKLFKVDLVKSQEEIEHIKQDIDSKLTLAEQRREAALQETREVAHRENVKSKEAQARKVEITKLQEEFGQTESS